MGALTYDPVAANNTSIDGVGSQGTNRANLIDDLARSLAAGMANLVRDLGGFNTVGGSADAISITTADLGTITSYANKILGFVAAGTNTVTGVTLNVDSVGAEPVKKAVAGVETALAVGDIVINGYYLVRWRSSWDSGGGAWELLDLAQYVLPTAPQFTTIELGHASDTTLARAAAGVMAVEGNVVPSPGSQAQYDMLVRGASSWDRLAIGSEGRILGVRSGTPAWGSPATQGTVQATTSGTSKDFTIPTWAKVILVTLDQVSFNSSTNPMVQLGTGGSPTTSGYTCSVSYVTSGSGSGAAVTKGFQTVGTSAGNSVSGTFMITNVTGNVWVCMAMLSAPDPGQYFGTGRVTLSGALDMVRFSSDTAATMDLGNVNVTYW